MIYDAQKHQRAFEIGAPTLLANRSSLPQFLRRRIIRGFERTRPSNQQLYAWGTAGAVKRFMRTEAFREEVGSVWMVLLGFMIEAALKLLIEYWFETHDVEGQL